MGKEQYLQHSFLNEPQPTKEPRPRSQNSDKRLREAIAPDMDVPKLRKLASDHERLEDALRTGDIPAEISWLLSLLTTVLAPTDRDQVRSPSDVAVHLMLKIGHLCQEQFCVVCLNTKNSTAACAFSTPLLAGFLGSQQTGRIRTGASIGVWSGLLSGSWTFILLMLLTLGGVNHGLPVDAKDMTQFQHSGAPDIATFLVGEALAGAIVHLALIGPVWGGILGALGGVLGRVGAPAPSPPPTLGE